ncbi:unnamed protein product [Mytilus coruscus]|uniref:SGNH hydrolase-type esterase domain-containing protein n=1 Tax=Mytilus coruscus TaxID=42192 RepID=A0A6J8CT53_MYTCO|nr:unnamed protein product [Mytilus coruscus]
MRSSIIRSITQDCFVLDIEPKCVRGGKVNDITAELLKLPKDTRLENVIFHVGSNDCLDKNFNPDVFYEDYTTLALKAKSVSENVVVSGLCPRLDDKFGNISRANTILQKIANDETLHYVDNDDTFRLSNGSVDTNMYEPDGVHLNITGSFKLAENLNIKYLEPKFDHRDLKEETDLLYFQRMSNNPSTDDRRIVIPIKILIRTRRKLVVIKSDQIVGTREDKTTDATSLKCGNVTSKNSTKIYSFVISSPKDVLPSIETSEKSQRNPNIKCRPKRRFIWNVLGGCKDFVQDVSDARRQGDQNPDMAIIGKTRKLIGNSAYGSLIMDKTRHRNIKYVQGETPACLLVNKAQFRKLECISEETAYNEVELSKDKIQLDLSIQLGYMVLPKLRMLACCFDFMDV